MSRLSDLVTDITSKLILTSAYFSDIEPTDERIIKIIMNVFMEKIQDWQKDEDNFVVRARKNQEETEQDATI